MEGLFHAEIELAGQSSGGGSVVADGARWHSEEGISGSQRERESGRNDIHTGGSHHCRQCPQLAAKMSPVGFHRAVVPDPLGKPPGPWHAREIAASCGGVGA